MTDNGANHAPPFGPGMHVRPGPITSKCKRLDADVVLIHFEHCTGSTSLPVPIDFAKGLIAQLQEVTGGLVIP